MIVPGMRWYLIYGLEREEGVDSLGRGSTICRATARVVLRSEVKIVDV